jgi:hypothetical protein
VTTDSCSLLASFLDDGKWAAFIIGAAPHLNSYPEQLRYGSQPQAYIFTLFPFTFITFCSPQSNLSFDLRFWYSPLFGAFPTSSSKADAYHLCNLA